jgi:hypothetical protein
MNSRRSRTTVARKRPAVAAVCIHSMLLTLLVPGVADARGPVTLGWDNLRSLNRGSVIVVQMRGKGKYQGKLDDVTDQVIRLTSKDAHLELKCREIRTVAYFALPKANLIGGTMAAGGVALAAGAGLAGTAKDLNQLSDGQLTSSTGKHNLGLILGGFAIVAGGVLIIALRGRPKTVYDAGAGASSCSQP